MNRVDVKKAKFEGRFVNSFFYRMGKWSAHRKWLVISAWLVILAGVNMGSSALNGTFNAHLSLPSSPTQIGANLISSHTNQPSSNSNIQTGSVVFHVSNSKLIDQSSVIEKAVQSISSIKNIKAVTDPLKTISPNKQVAVSSIEYAPNVTALTPSDVRAVDSAVSAAREKGVSVDYGGDLGSAAKPSAKNSSSEIIGIGIAILILLFTFGSILATVIPILGAVVGVFAGLNTLGILSAWFQFPSESPTIALMMGLGVGIDYALFLGTRFRQLIINGTDPKEAVGQTVATSGRAIVIAATTVIISLLGLYASGLVFIGQLGMSACITVFVAALSSITLVPAMLGVAGRHIDKLKVRKYPIAETSSETSSETTAWHRYGVKLSRHPVLYLAVSVVFLIILALPVTTIQIGSPGVHAISSQYTERRASDAIDSGFGSGYQAQLAIAVKVPNGQTETQVQSTALSLRESLITAKGIKSVTPFQLTSDRALLIGKAIPTTSSTDPATAMLVHTLQNKLLPDQLSAKGYDGYVTGGVASSLAIQEAVAASLPIIIIVVVAAAVLFMLLTFRSPLLAIKAGVINLLSIGASYGVLVAVFQWGWGSSLIGMPEAVPIVPYVPMLMFAIVFGLSMDYEVFLLSRVRESWIEGKSNVQSVIHGLSITGRIINCAAVIMACVFLSFLFLPSATIKMLSLGLGVSVIIDATIVRLIIVPCAMFVFGRANWWTPRWLDRILPHLEP